MYRLIPALLLFSSLITAFPVIAKDSQERIIAGWLEKIALNPWQIELKAKLDSGAKTSSIYAKNIQRFEQNGKPWIRFDLPKGLEKRAIQHTVEIPLQRDVKVKRHNLPPAIRPVVELGFCINAHFYKAQFTLADRKKFNYPVLLGRRFLKNHVLIDAGETFLHSSDQDVDSCQEHKGGNQTVSQSLEIPSNLKDQVGQ